MTRDERSVIERIPPRVIAAVFDRDKRTIERKRARGRVTHKDTELREKVLYSSDRGQDMHDLDATAKGPNLKLGCYHETAEFIRCHIVEHKESPDVVAHRMKQAGMEGVVCTKTPYNYIEEGHRERLRTSSISPDLQDDHGSVTTTTKTGVTTTHPYSSWERGLNENANRIIRRFIPKGVEISRYSKTEILEIESWINTLPRKLLDGLSAQQKVHPCFREHAA